MKKSFFFSAFVLAAMSFAAAISPSASAQAPQPQPGPPASEPAGPPPPPRLWPKPTNLKVLPKDLDGQQVRDIMEGWEGQLGVHCDTCHTPDPTRKTPNGRPVLNYADDSKPEKNAARLMYRMLDDINTNYVSMIPNSGMGATCGTCHRGRLAPEPYVPTKEQHGPRRTPQK